MTKGSDMTRSQTRCEEILSATQDLFETMNYRDINLKEISRVTSMSRPSIYNYFETKEEIFLMLLTREYVNWAADLDSIQPKTLQKTGMQQEFPREEEAHDFSHQLASSLTNHMLMLKLISNNIADFEENSRMDNIVQFKTAYGRTLTSLNSALQRFFPTMNAQSRSDFLYAFMPMLYGLYPYAVGTKKQREAMKIAKVDYTFFSVDLLVEKAVNQLLGCKAI